MGKKEGFDYKNNHKCDKLANFAEIIIVKSIIEYKYSCHITHQDLGWERSNCFGDILSSLPYYYVASNKLLSMLVSALLDKPSSL